MGLEQIQVELLSHWGAQDEYPNMAHAAWVSSYNAETAKSKTREDVEKVLNTIVNKEHTTPWETLWFKFWIKTPIFVERQLDKYRMTVQQQDIQITYEEAAFGRLGITQNEMSGRYRQLPCEMYYPKELEGNDTYYCIMNNTVKEYLLQLKNIERLHGRRSLEFARAKEIWRGVLPTAMLTEMHLQCNLLAFWNVCKQRLAKDAQLECCDTVKKMYNSCRHLVPNALQLKIDELSNPA